MGTNFQINYENTPFVQPTKLPGFGNLHGLANRLNWRCEILLARNQEAIKGKRILDLASHDGRFSYGCLALGADHVTGVEGRHALVSSAIKNMTELGYTPEQYDFIEGDVFEYLSNVRPKEFDTILCFGFFYHTIKQIQLLEEIRRIQPAYFILDTLIARGRIVDVTKVSQYLRWHWYIRQMVKLARFIKLPATVLKKVTPITFAELAKDEWKKQQPNVYPDIYLAFAHESHSLDTATIDPSGLVAFPTKPFLQMIFKTYGFALRQLYWHRKEIRDWAGIGDYRRRDRVSYIAQLG